VRHVSWPARVHLLSLISCLALGLGPGLGAVRGGDEAEKGSLAPLPGKGLAQHPFLYAGEWDTRKPVQTMFVVRDGKVVWSYSIPSSEELGDASMLSNGNIVFSRKVSASEVTPGKRTRKPPKTNATVHTSTSYVNQPRSSRHITKSQEISRQLTGTR
jgi:hypothetical protein